MIATTREQRQKELANLAVHEAAQRLSEELKVIRRDRITIIKIRETACLPYNTAQVQADRHWTQMRIRRAFALFVAATAHTEETPA